MNETIFSSENGTLTVKRIFDAPIHLVWKAWTEQELLDQWWAPKPWKSETREMEFEVGGYRLYAMVSPDGVKHWGRTDYESIIEPSKITGSDSFCDERGEVFPSFPIAKFTNLFKDLSGSTEVTVITEYESEESLKKVIDMGMKEGLTMAYENLDYVLENI